ncbi:hypothetical protein D082_23010 [Synechocystis sp. PCC 6714]|nr:hypothetical protein D082_23010 [Synechocystis sp. PCC 6714]
MNLTASILLETTMSAIPCEALDIGSPLPQRYFPSATG